MKLILNGIFKTIAEMFSKVWRGRGRKLFGALLGIVLGIFIWYLFEEIPLLKHLELATYDLRMVSSPATTVSKKILFVDIDDQSLRLFGRWPWSRDRFQILLRVLDEFDSLNTVFDIEFLGNSVGMAESSEVFRKISAMVKGLNDSLGNDAVKVESILEKFMKVSAEFSASGDGRSFPDRETGEEFLGNVLSGVDYLSSILGVLRNVETAVSELAVLVDFNVDGPDEKFEAGLLEYSRAILGYHFQSSLSSVEQAVEAADLLVSSLVGSNPEIRFSDLPDKLRNSVPLDTLRRLLRLQKLKNILMSDIDASDSELEMKIGVGSGFAISEIGEARKRAIFESALLQLSEAPSISLENLIAKLSQVMGAKDGSGVSREDFIYGATWAMTHFHIVTASNVKVMGIDRISLPESQLLEGPPVDLCRRARMAFVNAMPDSDGVFRRVPLFYRSRGKVFLQLALTGFLTASSLSGQTLEITPRGSLQISGAGRADVPLTRNGELLVNWAGEYGSAFDHISAAALLDFNRMRVEKERELSRISDLYEMGFLNRLRERKSEVRNLLRLKPGSRAGDFPQLGSYDPELPLKNLLEIMDGEEEKSLEGLIPTLERTLAKLESARPRFLEKPDRLKDLDERIKAVKSDMVAVGDYKVQISKMAARLKSYVKDRICLVGMSATSTTDIGVTPFQRRYPMVGIHGNILNTLISGKYIVQDSTELRFFLFLALGAVTGFIVPGFRIKRGGSLCLLLSILYSFAAVWTFRKLGVWLALAGPLCVILVSYTLISFIKFITEEKEKRFIKGAFGQYLSPKIIEQILADPSKLQLGGEKKVCTAFFSDVAGFSTISEHLTPEELVQLLNEYLTEMTNIILSYDGTVDKYEGDAIIAIFGAPINYDDHARRACEASVRMQKRLIELRDKWRSEGKQELTVRIGLNTGAMVVGNMGSIQRMDYTMMGDSVNLASRLEGANKPYGTHAMISEFTYEHCRDFIEARELDKIRVVGKNEPITVYELMDVAGGLDVDRQRMVTDYHRGLQLYKSAKWEDALKVFQSILADFPEDGPSRTYEQRCREFIASPPSADWDGVYVLKSK
ncbi:MAG: hypothetical protein CVV64_07975 [Candidatus Wallbacteria bacterium HGW-Wallbacteria-1]|jgi:class 3 adenylate cyclase/CHASE2 domain-containing sensor protein|uniref:Guanylate cyclase domain-containing protein n=1 Tax=Candidatus Wallbacteria bacterium HGW-Wallbacteria-1 TaxID=2013854 RepID=A0A2N1PR60_9BACT|nr:MAG: hypothetical protein CVV64_07975 [Candidatus Wallbacteria bacterium HGW-Wallbacteria-1]